MQCDVLHTHIHVHVLSYIVHVFAIISWFIEGVALLQLLSYLVVDLGIHSVRIQEAKLDTNAPTFAATADTFRPNGSRESCSGIPRAPDSFFDAEQTRLSTNNTAVSAKVSKSLCWHVNVQ